MEEDPNREDTFGETEAFEIDKNGEAGDQTLEIDWKNAIIAKEILDRPQF